MVEITPRLSIGQVAERTGLSVHALRFYETEDLFLTPVRRGAGGRRVYSEDDVAWLTVCIILRHRTCPCPCCAGTPPSSGRGLATRRSGSR
ncbi:MerR family transcriptional regulator [Streptomyces arboris]|uniref:MerR family transcriptional regulator n=1 Tax=Streptomyces arboris TaxID=2600619 RepID=UPI003C2DEE0F